MKKYIILHYICSRYLVEINSKYLFTGACYNIVIVKILNFSISKYLLFHVVKSRKTNKKYSKTSGKGCKFLCFRALRLWIRRKFSLWVSCLCNSLTQNFWHTHLKLASFINSLLKEVDSLSDQVHPLCTHMKNESLLYIIPAKNSFVYCDSVLDPFPNVN